MSPFANFLKVYFCNLQVNSRNTGDYGDTELLRYNRLLYILETIRTPIRIHVPIAIYY